LSKKLRDTFYAAWRATLEVNREARRADSPTLAEPNAAANAVDYAKFYSRSHHAVIRVYDDAGNVIETDEHKGDFKESP